LLIHREEAAGTGAVPVVAFWCGEGTARRLKLWMTGGLEFERIWSVPRTSFAAGV
jgi:hypothetical protein